MPSQWEGRTPSTDVAIAGLMANCPWEHLQLNICGEINGHGMHYKASQHVTTGTSPAHLMLGWEMILPLDRLKAKGTEAVGSLQARAKPQYTDTSIKCRRILLAYQRQENCKTHVREHHNQPLLYGSAPPLWVWQV